MLIRVTRALPMLVFLLGMATACLAQEDDYLKTLEYEAQKLDLPPEEVIEPEKVAPVAVEMSDDELRALRLQFEAELRRHRGTYSFYRRLEEQDRAEAFKAWREGASFTAVRRLIINRRMHR